ncbi:MAG: hypothetical protein JXQ90_18150 [Cyclobacteriaceae bacterium]
MSLKIENIIKSVLIVSMTCCVQPSELLGQGCSDAGFCTMGAMRPDQGYSKKLSIRLRSIEFSHYLGKTRFKDLVFNYTTDFNFGLNDRTTIQVKIPYVYVQGVLKDTNGIGDLSLSATRNIVANEKYQVNFTLGTKLPTGNSNFDLDGKPLPMYYQAGLGTYDIIAGISVISRGWLLAAGYQQALNRSNNDFWWTDWENHVDEHSSVKYRQSRSLNRGKDIMFRVEKNFRFSNFNFNVGLLPIYRINKDDIISRKGEKLTIPHTDGLALSLLVGGGYQFSVKSGIKIMNGFRLERRPHNPDGLSREFVSNVGYVYRF